MKKSPLTLREEIYEKKSELGGLVQVRHFLVYPVFLYAVVHLITFRRV